MKTALSAVQLERAASLTKEIEGLDVELGKANAVVQSLSDKVNPLRTELDGIMGYKAFKAPGVRFTPEQRAKISAGLKAKWAERKAKAAAAAVPVDGAAAPANA